MEKKIKIGLIGGMSYHSTIDYYKLINDEVNKKYGGLASAEFILHNVNFSPIEDLMKQGKWDDILAIFVDISKNLEKIGVTHLVMCTNTMHKLVPEIEKAISIKFIHIVDAVGQELVNRGRRKVLLLGTKFTMEENFYKQRLKDNFDIDVIVPNKKERERINRIIFNELCKGKLSNKSLHWMLEVVATRCYVDTTSRPIGAILACTELKVLEDELLHGPYIYSWDALEYHAKAVAEML